MMWSVRHTTYMYVSCREVIEKQLYDVIGKAHYIHVRIQ